MHKARAFGLPFVFLTLALGCTDMPDAVIPTDEDVPPDESKNMTASKIKHLVVIIQENHTFDNYFGLYCRAATGSNPTCNDGPSCCEAAPGMDPGTGGLPVSLTDDENGAFNPNHNADCELDEVHGGKMDQFVSSKVCGSPRNFAISPAQSVMPYWELAGSYALADRYFQPVIGASSGNDMYFARASFVFADNDYSPGSIGTSCSLNPSATKQYSDRTIGDLLVDHSVPWAFYAEGYQAMLDAQQAGMCPQAPSECSFGVPFYPCVYDPGDVPFQYYPPFRDNPVYMRDFARLASDVKLGVLPAVSFVKAIGYKTEHPGTGATIQDGTTFVRGAVDALLGSRYAASTLILVVYDEGGGYFDHVTPPPPSAVDGHSYGTRVPLLAIGNFARKNFISHVTMEHSSVVKFIEWNWLDQKTGQLSTRDTEVNNLGSLLDPLATGTGVPEKN